MLRRLSCELLALIAPPACAACGAPLRADLDLLCPRCRAGLPWLGPAVCPRCALPLPCRRCPARGAAFSAAWAPMAHAGSARALVHALKFGAALRAADLMAAQIVASAPPQVLVAEALVPVPQHPAAARRRGFHPAGLLAAAISLRSGIPQAACLERGGAATRQLGASAGTRRAAGRLAIAPRQAAPARVVLVDDVHTTGATFEAGAAALREAGAGRVTCVAYARTLR